MRKRGYLAPSINQSGSAAREVLFLRSLVALLLALPLAARADETTPSSDELRFFESRIRPVLVEHCYECHSTESGVSESGLRLDTRKSIREGGDRGAAVEPGQPEQSLILKAISHTDADLQMPPQSERLPAEVIADFQRWIRRGAVDPRDDDPTPWKRSAGAEFWAYQPPAANEPPQLDSDWCRAEVDSFVLEKLRANKLRPSRDAAPETLLRRLFFDLIGLPPEPEQIEDFLSCIESEGFEFALEQQVDLLLQSDRFGERWGRHWMDVARYAESSGKEANISFPYAWRYRDYVIDAVNDDLPFDRFVTEQLAGDLLPAANEVERTRLLIATGFLALGPKNLDAANPKQFAADLVDEQIDTVSRVFMASSIACARCHDHKFDPFLMEDYYALAGIFSSTRTFFGTAVSPSNRVGGDPLVLPRLPTTLVLHKSIPAARVKTLKAQKEALEREKEEKGAALTLRDALRIFWQTGGIEGQLEKVDAMGKALPLAMGVLEADRVGDAPLMLRGDVNRLDRPIPRAFPDAITVADPPHIPDQQSGRLELARWLTRDDHPLTARVAVNRIWSHLFGNGLVSSVDDFGSTGEAPSHAKLLDQLAVQFVRQGWSRKKMIRTLVLSRTYRQSSSFEPEAFRIDPNNRFLWRMSKRRLEAEAMRDAMLSVSGELDLQRPAGSLVGRVIGDRPISLVGLDKRLPADLDGTVHRSVYLPVLRDRLPDVLEVFDFAEPSLVTGKRETTNVPTQALYLMNSPFVRDRAAAMAKRLQKETDDDRSWINRAFQYCYGRSPDDDEATRVAQFLAAGKGQNENENLQRAISCCQALLSTAEFRILD